MPTTMFISQPCWAFVPAIMLATQPANAPMISHPIMLTAFLLSQSDIASRPDRRAGNRVRGRSVRA
jgi:hypothetical protein